MSRESPQPVALELDDLSAYLDGELDPAARRLVEQRLAEDPVWQQRLRQLEEAWELLDELPRTTVHPQFTATTITLATQTLEESQRGWRRWAPATWAWAMAAAVALVTMAGVQAWLERTNRRFLEDLPVIEQVDVYRYVDSLEFLRQLDQDGLFADEVDDAA